MIAQISFSSQSRPARVTAPTLAKSHLLLNIDFEIEAYAALICHVLLPYHFQLSSRVHHLTHNLAASAIKLNRNPRSVCHGIAGRDVADN